LYYTSQYLLGRTDTNYLNKIDIVYQDGNNLDYEHAAALTFACGVACTQVYSAGGSGTWGVDQAFEAYQKFNCIQAELLTETNEELYDRLSTNMKYGIPAHLALVDEAWSMGHNVIVDGYNTDDFYHVNFGWGGGSNGWYLIPQGMPMGLTVIEGLIVDILAENYTNIQQLEKPNLTFKVFPNPTSDFITIESEDNCNGEIFIYDASLRLSDSFNFNNQLRINLENYSDGIYFIEIRTELFVLRKKLIKI
jgi:hypothetical protein